MNARTLLVTSLIFSSYAAQAQQVFKCITPDGKVTFSNVTCQDPEGKSESVSIKINQVGSMATPEQINSYNNERNIAASEKTKKINETQNPTTLKEKNTVVRESCNTIGTSTFCRNSEGERKVTNKIGNTEFIREVDAEGNIKKTTKTNY